LKKFLQKFCSEGEQDMLKEALQKTKAALEEQDKLKQSNKELAGELNNQKNEIEKLRREIDASMN
jgi:predicted RNase H-like nuclease (RuvC/YqgF family)